MNNRAYKAAFLCFLAWALLPPPAGGQRPASVNAAPGLRLLPDTARQASRSLYYLPAWPAHDAGKADISSPAGPVKTPRIPQAYSYDRLGLFCKWEVRLEEAARLPVKIRLGEVQYVERLEGKLPDY